MSWSALLCGAASAWAEESLIVESSPASRPQAIPVESNAAVDDSLAEASEHSNVDALIVEQENAAAQVSGDIEPAISPVVNEAKSLGMPAGGASELESQRIDSQDELEPSSSLLGPLDPRTNQVTRVIGALGLVIGLILLLRSLVRRMGGPLVDGGRPSGVLLVLARYPVGRGQTLVLLKLGRRLLLCHQSKGEMSTLSEIEGEDEVAAMLARIEAGSRGKDATRFEKLLAEFNHEYRRRSIPSRSEAPELSRALAGAPVIDLTKKSSGGAANWLRLRRTAS